MSQLPVHSQRALATSFAKDLPSYFSYEEAHAILYAWPPYKKRSIWQTFKLYQARFLCYVLWHTGARITEARNLTTADIEPYTRVVKIRTLKQKGGKEKIRIIPKSDDFFYEFYLYVNSFKSIMNKEVNLLFPVSDRTARRYVTEQCKLAGITDSRAHPHTFRHSFAINCVLQGVGIPTLQKWLGHGDITKTMIYLKITDKDTGPQMQGVKF